MVACQGPKIGKIISELKKKKLTQPQRPQNPYLGKRIGRGQGKCPIGRPRYLDSRASA